MLFRVFATVSLHFVTIRLMANARHGLLNNQRPRTQITESNISLRWCTDSLYRRPRFNHHGLGRNFLSVKGPCDFRHERYSQHLKRYLLGGDVTGNERRASKFKDVLKGVRKGFICNFFTFVPAMFDGFTFAYSVLSTRCAKRT